MNLTAFGLGSNVPVGIIIILAALVILLFNKNLRTKILNIFKGISTDSTSETPDVIEIPSYEYNELAAAFKVVFDHIKKVGNTSDINNFRNLIKLMLDTELIDEKNRTSTDVEQN